MATHDDDDLLFRIQMSSAPWWWPNCLVGPTRALVTSLTPREREMKLMTTGDLAIGRDLQVVETQRSTGPRGHDRPLAALRAVVVTGPRDGGRFYQRRLYRAVCPATAVIHHTAHCLYMGTCTYVEMPLSSSNPACSTLFPPIHARCVAMISSVSSSHFDRDFNCVFVCYVLLLLLV